MDRINSVIQQFTQWWDSYHYPCRIGLITSTVIAFTHWPDAAKRMR